MFVSGEFVAQFKFTVILMPNGPLRITGMPYQADLYHTEHSIQNEDIKVRRELGAGGSNLEERDVALW